MIRSLIWKLCDAYELLVLVWCIMSWIPRGNSTVESIRAALGTIVEPYLSIFRKYIPPLGGIDFSPIAAIFVLDLIKRLVFNIL